jgi:hypothetical protein
MPLIPEIIDTQNLDRLGLYPSQISVEGSRKLAIAKDDRRLVIIVAHSASPVDEKATTPSTTEAMVAEVPMKNAGGGMPAGGGGMGGMGGMDF